MPGLLLSAYLSWVLDKRTTVSTCLVPGNMSTAAARCMDEVAVIKVTGEAAASEETIQKTRTK